MRRKYLCMIILVPLMALFGWGGGIEPAGAVGPLRSDYEAYPSFMANTAAPLVMLVMGRDHKLFYEAYNDASDLNGDGVLDTTYKPDVIDYYGYFDSYKYYLYVNERFEPAGTTADKKIPTGCSNCWSGDFLNYLTTSRMDAIRKVLYGGYRLVDTATETVLERAYIPQDAHSWGKEYESVERDGYDIRHYAPLDLPVANPNQTRHLFASTSLFDPTHTSYRPLLRVLNDSVFRIWEWVSIERPVAGTRCLDGSHATRGVDCATTGGTEWQITPNNSASGLSNVIQTVYSTVGYTSSPGSHTAYNTLEATYGLPALRIGSAAANTINGTQNPFSAQQDPNSPEQNDYMTIFTGIINIPADGTYTFAVAGDDAVEFMIDTNSDGEFSETEVIAHHYGLHGEDTGFNHTGSVTLNAGSYAFKYRHHERTGGSAYRLYWRIGRPASAITDYTVRVLVGVPGMPEINCKRYPNGTYKPVGLLQRHGESESMYFGLISGSYQYNMSGGVLRKNISSIRDEINADTGQFTAVNGIVRTIDKFRITRFRYPTSNPSRNYEYDTGWVTTRPMNQGEFSDWGNPIAEMMFEALRYFGGETSPTSAFHSTSMPRDDALGLPNPSNWNDPYETFPECAKPFMLVISDIYPSYDSDQLPGSPFGTMGPTAIGGAGEDLNVKSLGDFIFSEEEAAGDRFIGQVNTHYDGACTAKTVEGFGDIRGLCPEEPTKQGSYYSAAVAYYGRTQNISNAPSVQNVRTYSVALASPLPNIEIPLQGSIIRLVPFAKSVSGFNINPSPNHFQPTNTIVDFYVDTIQPHFGRFRINFEDVEQGADHDMDAIVLYQYQLVDINGEPVTAETIDQAVAVDITLVSEYAAGSIVHHIGYIISGTTNDGTYLEVRDQDTGASADVDYFLDTPPGVWADTGGTAWNNNQALPLETTRRFSADPNGGAASAALLPNPLWYAAKWGGFDENPHNATLIPDDPHKWDKDNDGVPDTYFYVANPLRLEEQLNKSFADILSKSSSGTAAAVVANNHEGEGNMIQAFFVPHHVSETGEEEVTWIGHLNGFWVDTFGNLRDDSGAGNKGQLVTTGSSADKIIQFAIDGNGTTYIKRYTKHFHYDPNNQDDRDCVLDEFGCQVEYDVLSLDQLDPIFAAGDLLHQRDAQSAILPRQIFTYIGSAKKPVSATYNDEIISMDTVNAELIKPFLGLRGDTAFPYLDPTGGPDHDVRVSNLIDFIRGVDSEGLIGNPGTRNRTIHGNVWKLGDIINSTPVSVSAPQDAYAAIYGDKSYLNYYRAFKDRETVIYAGANDGMLHAFTSWKYNREEKRYDKPSSAPAAERLGDEIWAYIPQALLPHLKWLADPSYGHSFYVDAKPKVFDARIVEKGIHYSDNEPGDHWGTFILLGLGMGGKHIWVNEDFGSGLENRHFYPTYTLIDITKPREPRVVWERSYEGLGMSASFPSIVQVGNTFDHTSHSWTGGRWLAVFGSGPQDAFGKMDYNGHSDQSGRIFVVDLKTGEPFGSVDSEGITRDWLFDTGTPRSVMASPAALDKGSDSGAGPIPGLTYNVDAIYMGSSRYDVDSEEWEGDMFKINTRAGTGTDAAVPSDDPLQWSFSKLFDGSGLKAPVTAPPSLTVDQLDNAWVMFGTGRFTEMKDRTTTEQQYIIGLKDPYFNKQYAPTLYGEPNSDYNGKGAFYADNDTSLTLTVGNLFYSNPYRTYATTGAIEQPENDGLSRITDWESLLRAVRNTEDQTQYPDYFDGWYRALDPTFAGSASERVVSKPAILGGTVFVPAYTPDDDICAYGGSTAIYGLYYESGTPAWQHIFKGEFQIDSVEGENHERVRYKSGLTIGPPPPSLSVQIGRGAGVRLYSQSGTGQIEELEVKPPFMTKSGVLFWQEE
jgi:type IV pilus assembly protein PilY1